MALKIIGLTAGIVAMWLFFIVGGWKLALAMMLFGFSMNIDNKLKK